MTLRDIKRKKVLDARKALDAATDEWLEFCRVNPEVTDARRAAVGMIQREVADHYKLPISCMSAKSRTDELVLPRQVAMSISRGVAKRTFQEIGKEFGGRDHGTVIFACESIENRVQTDPRFKAEYLSLRKRCETIVDNLDTPLFAVNGQ
jgi:chromosomal replication initiation ATPase DnaA